MLQRIQSLYLLIALIIMGIVFSFPFAAFIGTSESVYEFFIKGIQSYVPRELQIIYPLLILFFSASILDLTGIFMYKNRLRQIRFCNFSMILKIGLVLLMFFYTLKFSGQHEGQMYYRFFFILPVLSAFFNYLAYKGIKKDEELVRSVDRIR